MRLVPLLLALLGFGAAVDAAQPAVVAVDFNSVIHPITVDVLTHAIEQAHREGAPFLLIRLNTPGGMLEATQALVERINASPVPVVTFVTPSGGRAASAGFILLLAGDVAAMATGTHTGAASPVLLGQEMDATMRHKIENDTAAAVRSMALRHNRDLAAAQATVFEAKSYTSEEAANLRLTDLVVRDQQDLLNRLDGREITRPDGSKSVLHTAGTTVVDYAPSLRERAVLMVADPNLALFNTPGMVRRARQARSWCWLDCWRFRSCRFEGPRSGCWCSHSPCSLWKRRLVRTACWLPEARSRCCSERCCSSRGRPRCAFAFRRQLR